MITKIRRLPLARLAVAALACGAFAASEPLRDTRLPVDARVRDLVARMTLEKKIDQLTQKRADQFTIEGSDKDWNVEAIQPWRDNNTKIYGGGNSRWGSGSNADGVERFCRNIVGGCRSRPKCRPGCDRQRIPHVFVFPCKLPPLKLTSIALSGGPSIA